MRIRKDNIHKSEKTSARYLTDHKYDEVDFQYLKTSTYDQLEKSLLVKSMGETVREFTVYNV